MRTGWSRRRTWRRFDASFTPHDCTCTRRVGLCSSWSARRLPPSTIGDSSGRPSCKQSRIRCSGSASRSPPRRTPTSTGAGAGRSGRARHRGQGSEGERRIGRQGCPEHRPDGALAAGGSAVADRLQRAGHDRARAAEDQPGERRCDHDRHGHQLVRSGSRHPLGNRALRRGGRLDRRHVRADRPAQRGRGDDRPHDRGQLQPEDPPRQRARGSCRSRVSPSFRTASRTRRRALLGQRRGRRGVLQVRAHDPVGRRRPDRARSTSRPMPPGRSTGSASARAATSVRASPTAPARGSCSPRRPASSSVRWRRRPS